MEDIQIRYPKLHKTAVFASGGDGRFALLPVGKYCNDNISKAKYGERVRFVGEGKGSVFVIKRTCRVAVGSDYFRFMCHSIYGHGSFTRLSEEWAALSARAGLGGASAYSDREVLLVELGEWDKEVFAYEERKRIETAAAIARKAERERRQREFEESIHRQVESGNFNHPDVL